MRNYALIILAFSFHLLPAQNFQGIATYRTSSQVSIKTDSTMVNDAMHKELNEQLRKQFDNEYKLQFNRKESMYKVEENLKLDAPGSGTRGRITVIGNLNLAPLYKNTANGTYVKQEELLGKRFLVKDSLKMPDWKLETEQKKIGNYTCYKATWTREVEVSNWDTEEGFTKKMVEKTTTAWYTPEIPVNHGPREFWGLPGLILEIQENKYSLLCTEVILNPSGKFNIEIPTKGEVIDQESFNRISEEKNSQMMEMFSRSRDKKIKIGG